MKDSKQTMKELTNILMSLRGLVSSASVQSNLEEVYNLTLELYRCTMTSKQPDRVWVVIGSIPGIEDSIVHWFASHDEATAKAILFDAELNNPSIQYVILDISTNNILSDLNYP